MFVISLMNIQLLNADPIPATRFRRQGNWNISYLLAKFLPSSDENRSYPPSEFFGTPCCLDFKAIMSISSYPGTTYLCKHPLRVVGRSVRLGRPISRSLVSDIHIHFLGWTSHIVSLPAIFAMFRVLDNIMNYGRSKRVIEWNEFERPIFWES
jgi:hypothetical protein